MENPQQDIPTDILMLERSTMKEDHPWWELRLFPDRIELRPSSRGPEEALTKKHDDLKVTISREEAPARLKLIYGIVAKRSLVVKTQIGWFGKKLLFDMGEEGMEVMARWMSSLYDKVLEETVKEWKMVAMIGAALIYVAVPWKRGWPIQIHAMAVEMLLCAILLVLAVIYLVIARSFTAVLFTLAVHVVSLGFAVFVLLQGRTGTMYILAVTGLLGLYWLGHVRLLLKLRTGAKCPQVQAS